MCTNETLAFSEVTFVRGLVTVIDSVDGFMSLKIRNLVFEEFRKHVAELTGRKLMCYMTELFI